MSVSHTRPARSDRRGQPTPVAGPDEPTAAAVFPPGELADPPREEADPPDEEDGAAGRADSLPGRVNSTPEQLDSVPGRPDGALPTPVLRLAGASFGYGDRRIVQRISLRVLPGEVVALVGPNGAGKSTLLRGVLGLARLLEGEQFWFGTPARAFTDRYRVGYVPQRYNLAGGVPVTVREVVASGRLNRRRTPWPLSPSARRAERLAVDEAIAATGLTDQARTPAHLLSGGQQRRMLVSRALAGGPEVLLMDEPTAGVDPAHRHLLVESLDALVSAGLTLVVVTHELEALDRLHPRVVRLEAGHLRGEEAGR